jgi:hypothetical protein
LDAGNIGRGGQSPAGHFNAIDNGDNNNNYTYMHIDSPNWKTPHKYNATSLLTRSVQAPPPMESSQTKQEQGCAIHVHGFDNPEQDSDVIYPHISDQHPNVPPSRRAANAPAPTRPACLQPQNNTKAIARLPGKRQRELSPSLSASPSPSPAPLRARLRRSPHNPSPNLHAKSKSKVNGKIRNIDAYAFKGLNHHEAQDEEWSIQGQD